MDLLLTVVRVYISASWRRLKVFDRVESTSTQNQDPISETGDQIDLVQATQHCDTAIVRDIAQERGH